jgi:cell division topological specificity factor
MGLLDLFRKPAKTAGLAKERLRIIVSQERSNRGAPDYLPLLRREILEVIHRHVNIDPEAVHINVGREEGQDVFELSVSLPVKAPTAVQSVPRS